MSTYRISITISSVLHLHILRVISELPKKTTSRKG